LISVGLPAYKARYLKEAINSVLKQTYTDFELIIVNDASPENINGIVQDFNDPRIRYYENEKNLGQENLVENWNKVLNYARGEFFVLFSDDDVYEPTFLEEMLTLLKKRPSMDILHCRVRQVNAEGLTLGFTATAPEWENVVDFLYHRISLGRVHYIGEFLFRTRVLKDIGGFVDIPLAWGSDIATCCEVGKQNGVLFLSKPLYKYRYSALSLTNSGQFHKKVDGANAFYNWAIKFLNSALSEGYVSELIEIMKREMDDFTSNTIVNALARSSNHNLLGTFKLIRNWYLVKSKAMHKNTILLKAIAYHSKRVYEENIKRTSKRKDKI